MARSITEIQDEILAAKAGNTELDVLDSPSMVAIWFVWTYVIAVVIYTHEKLWDIFKLEIEGIKNSSKAGTPLWYVEQAKAFQYGDTVIIDPETFEVTYETIDESKQIVKRAAISSNAGVSTLKVAKEDVSNNPEALSAAELAAFKVYINGNVQFAGAQINIISNPADLLKIAGTIYYNGLLDPSEAQSQSEAAINNYLANLDFDGRFLRNKMIDAIQALGFDFDVDELEAKFDGGIYANVDRDYNSLSGYIVIDPAFPLSSQLNYVAE